MAAQVERKLQQEVATDKVRKMDWSRASNSPMSGEGMELE
jgi:hypothetical protein